MTKRTVNWIFNPKWCLCDRR